MTTLDEELDSTLEALDLERGAALEDILRYREETLEARNEAKAMLGEFERKIQTAEALERRRKRKFDAEDAIVGVGLAAAMVGVSVTFHWGYALIAAGSFVAGVVVLAKLVGAWNGPS